MTGRRRLPFRRPCRTLDLRWKGHAIAVTVGFDPDGRVLEVFGCPTKGSELDAVLADACVVISLALQHGVPPQRLARSVGRRPDPGDGAQDAPASPVGAILEALSEIST